MKEELIQIYNAVRRSHQNIMMLLLDKIIPEMTVENISASKFQETVQRLLALVYFNAQKNVLLTIKDIYKEQGMPSKLIEQMIMEREKESCQAITDIVNLTSVYKSGSPVPLHIAKSAKEKLEYFNQTVTKYDESGWPIFKRVAKEHSIKFSDTNISNR